MAHGVPGSKILPLTEPKYASFRHTSHCLHLDEALGSLNHRRLTPVRAKDTKAIIRSKVVWCTLGASNGHSMYGNVSFVADWSRVTSKLGSGLYFIDQMVGTDRCCTRLLLTRSSYEGVLQKVNDVEGSPIIEKMGQPFHIVRCLNKKRCDGPHEVKLAVEADESEANWLFSISHVLINDHFFVNLSLDKQIKRKDGRTQRYKHHKCFKYNSLLNALCPFQFRREDVDCKLRVGCPGVVLSDIQDLSFVDEQKHDHPNVKPIEDELSECRAKQKSLSFLQHYNCLADPKKMSGVESSLCEQNITRMCPISDILPTTGAAASGSDGARGALRCDQYHRYQPTKEDDAFQQGHFETPVGGNPLTESTTGDASENISHTAETGQMLSCVDRSPQTCLAGGHSGNADNNFIYSNVSSECQTQSVKSRFLEKTNHRDGTDYFNSSPDEILRPKLEIDLMKMALDDVQRKLLKLEKALTKSNQSSYTDTNIEISKGNFLDVVPEVKNQYVILKQVSLSRLSEVSQNPHQNVIIDSGQLGSNPVSQAVSLEPNRNINFARLPTDAGYAIPRSERGKYREQRAAPSGSSSGGHGEAPPVALPSADRRRQRKQSSTLYKSTLSSAVKARAKRESVAIMKTA